MPGTWINLTMNGGITEFLRALINELQNGLFLFSSPLDIFISLLDIGVTAFALYYVLKLISETRAWQLLKGLLWLFLFTLIAGWLGLNTINYVLLNSVSFLAVGIVVIFQPELRRALESVGRNSSLVFTSREEEQGGAKSTHNIIEQIVMACETMSQEKTGALIIIERQTKLGDLIESGTAVVLDAELSSTALRQIFYKNSPTHDGAVLIRGSRIYAARVHVPLSDSYTLRREMGTRHRAAIGASEIGDAIAIVCSEEHGTISLAVHGRLYTLDNADALRTVLHRLLGAKTTVEEHSLPKRIRKLLRADRVHDAATDRKDGAEDISPSTQETLDQINSTADDGFSSVKVDGQEVTTKPHRSRALLVSFALVLSVFLWLYVHITTNPIVNRTFTVPIQMTGIDVLDEQQLDYYKAENQVTVTVRGREQALMNVTNSTVDATIDFSQITHADTYTLPINVTLEGVSNLAYSVTWRNPDSVTVVITASTPGTVSPNNGTTSGTSGTSGASGISETAGTANTFTDPSGTVSPATP